MNAKERPIPFSSEMVRAILAGRKTQTRRVVKLTEYERERGFDGTKEYSVVRPQGPGQEPQVLYRELYATFGKYGMIRCPYGRPGDRLWVREAIHFDGTWVRYRADNQVANPDRWNHDWQRHWLPSIHMPRQYSRILLEVTGVRVERLQVISEFDVMAEGIKRATKDGKLWKYGWDGLRWMDWEALPTVAYRLLWDSINAKDGYSWESNPWVWVVEFKVLVPVLAAGNQAQLTEEMGP